MGKQSKLSRQLAEFANSFGIQRIASISDGPEIFVTEAFSREYDVGDMSLSGLSGMIDSANLTGDYRVFTLGNNILLMRTEEAKRTVPVYGSLMDRFMREAQTESGLGTLLEEMDADVTPFTGVGMEVGNLVSENMRFTLPAASYIRNVLGKETENLNRDFAGGWLGSMTLYVGDEAHTIVYTRAELDMISSGFVPIYVPKDGCGDAVVLYSVPETRSYLSCGVIENLKSENRELTLLEALQGVQREDYRMVKAENYGTVYLLAEEQAQFDENMPLVGGSLDNYGQESRYLFLRVQEPMDWLTFTTPIGETSFYEMGLPENYIENAIQGGAGGQDFVPDNYPAG